MIFHNRLFHLNHFLISFFFISVKVQAEELSKNSSNQPLNATISSSKTINQNRVLQALAKAWPDRPEWLDMFTDILAGSQLAPNDGWFRRSVSHTRFNWTYALKKFDRDCNQEISRAEFTGPENDFTRLDRDRDQLLKLSDFDFREHALTNTIGYMFFQLMDRDGNGRVTMEELEQDRDRIITEPAFDFQKNALIPTASTIFVIVLDSDRDGRVTTSELTGFFKNTDSSNLGYISLSDMKAAIDHKYPNPETNLADSNPTQSSRNGPSKETLIKGLFQQEIGALQAGPILNEKARDFTLDVNDGKQKITLSKLIGPKPVVLIFGNFTCGPFRMQAGNVDKLYQKYNDRATFVMVYVREAHPSNGWRIDNSMIEVNVVQPKTYEERVRVAQVCRQRLGFSFHVLVDSIEDSVGSYFSGMPSRLYIIDNQGKVAFKSARGPYGFKPDELEQSLILMLQSTNEL
jgi:hypothetical protein